MKKILLFVLLASSMFLIAQGVKNGFDLNNIKDKITDLSNNNKSENKTINDATIDNLNCKFSLDQPEDTSMYWIRTDKKIKDLKFKNPGLNITLENEEVLTQSLTNEYNNGCFIYNNNLFDLKNQTITNLNDFTTKIFNISGVSMYFDNNNMSIAINGNIVYIATTSTGGSVCDFYIKLNEIDLEAEEITINHYIPEIRESIGNYSYYSYCWVQNGYIYILHNGLYQFNTYDYSIKTIAGVSSSDKYFFKLYKNDNSYITTSITEYANKFTYIYYDIEKNTLMYIYNGIINVFDINNKELNNYFTSNYEYNKLNVKSFNINIYENNLNIYDGYITKFNADGTYEKLKETNASTLLLDPVNNLIYGFNGTNLIKINLIAEYNEGTMYYIQDYNKNTINNLIKFNDSISLDIHLPEKIIYESTNGFVELNMYYYNKISGQWEIV